MLIFVFTLILNYLLLAQSGTVWFNAEQFESGLHNTFNSTWHANIWNNPNVSVEAPPTWADSHPMVGDSCVKFNFPIGATAPWGVQHFGDAPDNRLPLWEGYADSLIDEVYFQYTIGYSQGYSWEFGNNKQFIIGCEDGQSHSYVCCNPSTAYYFTFYALSVNNDSAQFRVEANNKQAASGNWLDFVPNYGGWNTSPGSRPIFHGATVYTMEFHIVLNDSGQSNGILQVWYNGEQIMNYTNVYIRHFENGTGYGVNSDWGLNELIASWYINNPVNQEQAIYLFDVKMSTNYIGINQPTSFGNNNEIELPKKFSLMQNSPNPFNPSTKIKFNLKNSENVKIEVFNLLGQKLKTLINKLMPIGLHEINFFSTDLPSGVYLYRLEAGEFYQQKKMILMK